MSHRTITDAKSVFAVCLTLLATPPCRSGTATVSNASDTGSGSLRTAVTDVASTGGTNTIRWDDDWTVGTITLKSDLPALAAGTTLDVTDSTSAVVITGSGWAMPLGGDVIFHNDNISSTWTVSAILSGSGALIKTGDGKLTLTGDNTFTAGASINGGRVIVDGDAALGAASGTLSFDGGILALTATMESARTVTLNAGGGTVDTNAYDLSLQGSISGLGGLTKDGTGTLTLAAANTYAGGTTVSSGTLRMGADGALPSVGAVAVSKDAALRLDAFSQTVGAYDGHGVLSLALTPGTAALNVTTTASIDGTLSLALTPRVILAGDTFTPITAGALSGTFDAIIAPAALSFTPTYSADRVVLTAGLVPFVDIASTKNQRAVGAALESLRAAPTGDAAAVIGNLYVLDAADLRDALDNIGPIALDTSRELASAGARLQAAVLGRRLAGNTVDDGNAFTAYQEDGSPWGFFSALAGADTLGRIQDPTAARPDRRMTTGGAFMGVDYGGDHIRLGVFGGATSGHATVTAPGEGSMTSRSARYGLSLACHGAGVHAAVFAGRATDAFSSKRLVDVGTLARTANADTRGDETNTYARVAYDVASGGWGTASPFLTMTDDRLTVEPFTETGADGLNLSVDERPLESLRSVLGMHYEGKGFSGGYALTTRLAAGWGHEFKDPEILRARLAAGGGAMEVAVEDFQRDGATAEAAFSVEINRCVSFHVTYSGDYRVRFTEHTGSVGGVLKF